jgi:hypothetical protein
MASHKTRVQNGEARGATVRNCHCRKFAMLEKIWKTNKWVVAQGTCSIAIQAPWEASR